MHAILDYQASGLLDDAARTRLRLIEPHLRRALLIGNVIDLWRSEAATLIDVLDGISAAMFLVSAGGRIVDANASGHAMLAQGSLLRAAGGRLAPVDANASPALLRAMAIDGDAAVGVKSIPVPLRARDGDRYVAHVRPLTSGARQRVGARCEVAAAVLVHKPAAETGSAQEVIRKHYQLTPTELRVLLAVTQRDAVHEVAQALGITIPTLKTHLYRVFTKTGAKRRADLVKLVAGYASVLVH
jgi:DNA-binding CsgD family transcriptional regulator